jgi:hypothetical protein
MSSQVVVALLSIVVLLLGSASAQTIAVPSYIYPGNNDWQLITAAPGKVSFALINPLNGPGFSINNDYVLQTQRTKAAGIPVYGYVHSLYGQASLDVIQKNISTYYSWYPIDGIFVDEAAVDCASVGLYQSVYNFVKAKGGQVVINPGYMTNECYMSTADIVLIAENKWDLYLAPYVPPSVGLQVSCLALLARRMGRSAVGCLARYQRRKLAKRRLRLRHRCWWR